MNAEKTISPTSDSIFSTISVPENVSDLRIDQFVANQFPNYSRSFFKHLIPKKSILLNGEPVKKAGITVKSGDIISILVPPRPDTKELLKQKLLEHDNLKNSKLSDKLNGNNPENNSLENNSLESSKLKNNDPSDAILNIAVLYTHEHFLIIHKPVGVIIHKPHAHSDEITLCDWIVANYEELAHIGFIDRPGVVHRIDKNTSGLLIIARTNYAQTIFHDLFKERNIRKTYLAFVKGHPDKQGTITLAIGRDPVTKTKMIALEAPDIFDSNNPELSYAKEITQTPKNQAPEITCASKMRSTPKLRNAITHYQVKEYFDTYSLLEIQLITGRTHQIRAHFAAIGHPLIGDTVYGGPESPFIERQALHAHSISFVFGGQEFSFSCPMPEDMQRLIK